MSKDFKKTVFLIKAIHEGTAVKSFIHSIVHIRQPKEEVTEKGFRTLCRRKASIASSILPKTFVPGIYDSLCCLCFKSQVRRLRSKEIV